MLCLPDDKNAPPLGGALILTKPLPKCTTLDSVVFYHSMSGRKTQGSRRGQGAALQGFSALFKEFMSMYTLLILMNLLLYNNIMHRE